MTSSETSATPACVRACVRAVAAGGRRGIGSDVWVTCTASRATPSPSTTTTGRWTPANRVSKT